MKLGVTISVAGDDTKNLLKEGQFKISCLDFKILMTMIFSSGEVTISYYK